jgi:hypothetical protein
MLPYELLLTLRSQTAKTACCVHQCQHAELLVAAQALVTPVMEQSYALEAL